MNLTLKVKDVQFVNHNNRTAARSYIDLCNKLSKTFRDKYTDKHYIKDNWFTDKFIINDITADTIAKGIGQYILLILIVIDILLVLLCGLVILKII